MSAIATTVTSLPCLLISALPRGTRYSPPGILAVSSTHNRNWLVPRCERGWHHFYTRSWGSCHSWGEEDGSGCEVDESVGDPFEQADFVVGAILPLETRSVAWKAKISTPHSSSVSVSFSNSSRRWPVYTSSNAASA